MLKRQKKKKTNKQNTLKSYYHVGMNWSGKDIIFVNQKIIYLNKLLILSRPHMYLDKICYFVCKLLYNVYSFYITYSNFFIRERNIFLVLMRSYYDFWAFPTQTQILIIKPHLIIIYNAYWSYIFFLNQSYFFVEVLNLLTYMFG